MHSKLIQTSDGKPSIDEALQNFGLKRNEIKILKALISANGGELSVRKVSKLSELPIGRTYATLKNLFMIGLVDKKISDGIVFSIKDPEIKFHEFVANKYRDIMKNEKKIHEAILHPLKSGDAFIEILTDDDFYRTACQIALRSKEIKAFARVPVLFIPEEQAKSFLRNELLKIYREKISAGEEFFYIISENRFKNFINKKTKDKIIKNLSWCLKHKNFHLSIIKSQYFLTIVKGERDALLTLRYEKTNKVLFALHIRSNDAVRMLDRAFNNIFDDGKQIKKASDLIN